jgi:hypothetical protein
MKGVPEMKKGIAIIAAAIAIGAGLTAFIRRRAHN